MRIFSLEQRGDLASLQLDRHWSEQDDKGRVTRGFFTTDEESTRLRENVIASKHYNDTQFVITTTIDTSTASIFNHGQRDSFCNNAVDKRFYNNNGVVIELQRWTCSATSEVADNSWIYNNVHTRVARRVLELIIDQMGRVSGDVAKCQRMTGSAKQCRYCRRSLSLRGGRNLGKSNTATL